MASYAFGDLQGCLDPLQRLLERLRFDPAADRLYFVGDLVNRGPQSLQALRFVRGLGERALTTLGNHDLHLLAMRAGIRKEHRNDTLRPVLQADDGDELLDWLRRQPLLHRLDTGGYVLTHAGIYPPWSLEQAQACAAEVERQLGGDECGELLHHMYGDQPARWHDGLRGYDRSRFIINAFTRMRFCSAAGELDFSHNGPPGSQPAGLSPWFLLPRAAAETRIVFGHWAALGPIRAPNLFALDTGCVWGGQLTALRLDCEPPRTLSENCARS